MPDEAKLAAVIKTPASGTLTAYVDTVSATAAARADADAGHGREDHDEGASGITEWELSNGVRVVLKPTTFKQDEILFRAFSPGGTSLASDAGLHPGARPPTRSLPKGGLGKLSAIDLSKMLAGKVAVVRPDIGETDEGLRGQRARSRDLETMFQLIYLTVHAAARRRRGVSSVRRGN